MHLKQERQKRAHISRLNCAKMDRNIPKQHAYKIFSFSGLSFNPLGSRGSLKALLAKEVDLQAPVCAEIVQNHIIPVQFSLYTLQKSTLCIHCVSKKCPTL